MASWRPQKPTLSWFFRHPFVLFSRLTVLAGIHMFTVLLDCWIQDDTTTLQAMLSDHTSSWCQVLQWSHTHMAWGWSLGVGAHTSYITITTRGKRLLSSQPRFRNHSTSPQLDKYIELRVSALQGECVHCGKSDSTATTVSVLARMRGKELGLSDNIVLSIIAIKSQYRNRDISESESCDASHVFALQRWQKRISSFYLLKVLIVLYAVILDSQRAMGRFWSQTERNVSLCTVSSFYLSNYRDNIVIVIFWSMSIVIWYT